MDTIDILSEVILRFGHLLASEEKASIGISSVPALQKSIQDNLLQLLNHSRPAVRKKTTTALGHLVAHTPDELFSQLMTKLITELKTKESSGEYEKLRTFISCLSTLRYFNNYSILQYYYKIFFPHLSD